MKFALNEQNFEDTTIVLVASMKHPWKIMESLEYWSARLQDHIDSLNLTIDQIQNLRDKCVDRFIDYSSPDGMNYFLLVVKQFFLFYIILIDRSIL